MRRLIFAAMFLLACPIAVAQLCHHAAAPAPGDEFRRSPCCKPFAAAVLQPELQKVKWLVTGKPEAQPFFSQGMTQYYGFNYEEALRNFRMAKQLDGTMAMASWGIALAAGPNINLGMDRDCHEIARDESRRAVDKAKLQPGITPLELALIDALPLRYDFPERKSSDPAEDEAAKKALKAYSDALGAKWKDFQGDPNFGALYAESMIELHPWALYKDRLPTTADTAKIIEVLKTAMDVDPIAVGANHYWIHVAEAGPKPDDALGSANLLQVLVEASGHLVHMPSHIYLLLGKYRLAVESNEQAALVDVSQYKDCCSGSFIDYSANPSCPQLYYGHYLSHNYFFGSVSATFSGQSRKAVAMACDTRAHVQNFLVNEPGLQRYMTAPLMTLVVNRNWEAIDKYPAPPDDCFNQPPFKAEPGCFILRSVWYWAKGMRLAALDNPRAAKVQYDAMGKEMDKVALSRPDSWGNNSAVAVLKVGQSLLRARYMWPADQKESFSQLAMAVNYEDELNYDEPPQWFPPARESLGGAYLAQEEYKLAKDTFDEELDRHRASGRALYGRMRALQGLGDTANAAIAKDAFCKAWEYADYKMTEGDLWPVPGNNSDPGITCPRPAGSKPRPSGPPSVETCVAPPWPPTPSGRCPKTQGVPAPASCPKVE